MLNLPGAVGWWRGAAAVAALLVAWPCAAQLRVLVNPGDQGEKSRHVVYSDMRGLVERSMARAKTGPFEVALSIDATADLGGTRSRLNDVLVAPAHVIGSAVRYGYTPLLGLEPPVQAVLVTLRDSPVGNLSQAVGKRLGLPLQDSVVTYLVRGEVNAANTTIRRHFASVYETRYQEALLVCLQIRRCDVVGVERSLFDRWVAAGEPVRQILQSRPVPGLGVAVKDGSAIDAPALSAALADGARALRAGKPPVVLAAADYEYVSTLGYFTPRSLPGATVVDAAAVARLLPAATFVDTRTEVEFKAGRVPGARLLPYVEKSAKDADYQAGDDQFDLTRLPAARDTMLVFACNGPECWKSYKASKAALQAGYTRVHWFRGGLPEWRQAGQRIATGG